MNPLSKKRNTLILLVVTVAQIGCAGGLGGTALRSTIDNNEVKQGNSIWKHGNFCGKGHPDTSNISGKSNKLHALLKKPALDNFDSICKYHDICYEIQDGPDKNCDTFLNLNLELLKIQSNRYREISNACYVLFKEIEIFAETQSSNDANNIFLTIFVAPFFAISSLFSTIHNVLSSPFSALNPSLSATVGNGCNIAKNPTLIAPINLAEFNHAVSCYKTFFKNGGNGISTNKYNQQVMSYFKIKYGAEWENQMILRGGCIDFPVRES